jgi:hypothetical protein
VQIGQYQQEEKESFLPGPSLPSSSSAGGLVDISSRVDAAVTKVLEDKLEWFEQRISSVLDKAMDKMEEQLTCLLQKRLSLPTHADDRSNEIE